MPKLTPAQMKAAVEEFKKQFTPGFYHGSPSPNIKAFDPLKSPKGEELVTPGVTFLTPKPEFAESFLNPGSKPYYSLQTGELVPQKSFKTGSTIYPVSVNLGKHFDPSTPEGSQVIKDYLAQRYAKESSSPDFEDIVSKKHEYMMDKLTDPINNWRSLESPSLLQHLRDTGHNTFSVTEGGIKNVGVFDPKDIRGKFAKFNPEDAESPDFMKAEGGSVEGYAPGGKVGLALDLAKQIAPKFSAEAIQNMPVSSAAKQLPVAKAFQMLSSENVDPAIKNKIFQQYVFQHPSLVKKSGATNYDELTQAAYEKMLKETKDQYDLMTGAGIKVDWDPTGAKGYKSSADMLKDIAENKRLTVFQGGEAHSLLPGQANEQFRAVHDYFGHGTTGSSFGPKGEELAYGAHSQMYSPLAKLAAAAETRGQNSFVNYSGINEDLIKKMNEARAKGASPEELQQLGQQWQYAPQKGLILPPEQVDINYKGYAPGGSVSLPDVNLSVNNLKPMPGAEYSGMPTTPGVMGRLQLEQELEKARLRAGISGLMMALPNQHGVKSMPGSVDVGVNLPINDHNLDLSAYRSIAPIPGKGHAQGINARYTIPFAAGGSVKKALEFAKSIPFVHFSKADNIARLEPLMYGTGVKGAEGARLQEAADIRPRSYFYVDTPNVKPEAGLGAIKYRGVSEASYPLSTDPAGYYKIAKELAKDPYFAKQGVEIIDRPKMLNEVERAIKNAGYSGYHVGDETGIVFHPTDVVKISE